MGVVVITLVAISLTTYAIPALKFYRPWVPGEAIPLLRLFSDEEQRTLPGFAEAGEILQPTTLIKEGVARSLGDTVADNLGEGDEVYSEQDSERQDGSDTEHQTPAAPVVKISAEELKGLGQLIEVPSQKALIRFYRALYRTARKESGAITRIAHYGDSSTAADHVTSTMRRRMQRRFGDAGHGFILISRGNMHYIHKDIRHHASNDWELYSLVQRTLGEDWYGYGGVQYRGKRGVRAYFSTVKGGPVGNRVSRFEIFYQSYKRGAEFELSVDGKDWGTLDTRSEEQRDAWKVINVPDGPHSLKIQAKGRGIVRLYGVALERDVPGVVYDSLGLVGARAQRLLNAERAHMKRQVSHRNPDLLILAFGGNEAGNKWLNMEHYEKELIQVVKQMRGTTGDIPCLLFGPLDQGDRDERGAVKTMEKLPQIVEVQRRVAFAQQCAFFDTYSAMGGLNSVWRWYRSRPRLATSDFRHATPAGYEVIGNMFYKAVLKGFSDFLASDRVDR